MVRHLAADLNAVAIFLQTKLLAVMPRLRQLQTQALRTPIWFERSLIHRLHLSSWDDAFRLVAVSSTWTAAFLANEG